MKRFLEQRWSFEQLGVDVVYIFQELAMTSTDPILRRQVSRIAKKYGAMMSGYFAQPGKLRRTDVLIDAFDLLSEAHHLKISPQPLLGLLKRRFRTIRDTASLMQVDQRPPSQMASSELFDVLINAFVMEKVALGYPGQFPVGFGLDKLWPLLRKRRYLSFYQDSRKDKKLFADDAFLVTHIAYVLSFYGRIKLRWRDFPRGYRYLRRNFHAVLAHKDVEILAEIVDVFRSLGLDERSDRQVRLGTWYLLETQNADGSWGPWKSKKNPYDAIHYTWCAVLGLRDRTFWRGTRYEKRIREVIGSR